MTRRLAVGGILAIVLILLGNRIVAIIAPPTLALTTPSELLATSSRIITVRGTTDPGATVRINGASFVPDAQGVFAFDVVLVPGTNTLDIEAQRRHSRTTKIQRHVFVSTAEAPVA